MKPYQKKKKKKNKNTNPERICKDDISHLPHPAVYYRQPAV